MCVDYEGTAVNGPYSGETLHSHDRRSIRLATGQYRYRKAINGPLWVWQEYV